MLSRLGWRMPSRLGWSCLAALILLVSLAAATAGAAPEVPEGARAGAALGGPERAPRAVLSLLLDRERARPGETVRVGVYFELESDWHVYWRFSGESGLPTELAWKLLPQDASSPPSLGPLRWPAPSVFREDNGFITTYGYSDELLLSADLTLPEVIASEADPAPESVRHRIEVEADFLVCKIQCIPGRASLYRELEIGPRSVAADRETVALFDRFEARTPMPASEAGVSIEALYSQTAVRPGDSFRAGVAVTCSPTNGRDCGPLRPGVSPSLGSFVPDQTPGIELSASGTRAHPLIEGGLIVTLEGRAGKDALAADLRLRGVLSLEGAHGPLFVDVDLELPTANADATVTPLASAEEWLVPGPEPAAVAARSISEVLAALALAFLGGLILNLMPCVFPVLAIKVFSVAELAHAGRARAVGQGLAYTSGVIVSMLALALIVVALRGAGVAVGWGFQFQEPLFVLGVGTVLVVFALNLFGVFEISPDLTRVSQVGEGATGNARSFFEGLLAVVLATPCSAPYLGTAVGFAFASSAAMILALFATIGVGLAAPYLAITCIPGLSRFMPRPGEWMLHLRSALGFALLGTVVWLLSILGSSVESAALVLVLAFLLVVALMTWLFGVLQAGGRVWPARVLAVGFLLLLGTLAPKLPLEARGPGAEDEAESASLNAQAFDAAGVRESLRDGKPVFVYFTADWCLTCKVNERLVFEDASVQAEIESLGFDVFVGDWTRRDEAIRAELARFGRAAVPMYLVYSPTEPASPELLPELLTPTLLIDALKRAAVGPVRAADHTGGDAT